MASSRRINISLTSLFILLAAGFSFAGLDLRDMGYVDVTEAPYGCDNTGNTDVSDKLQEAINYARDNDLAVFLPAGDYLVSKTIECHAETKQSGHPIVLVGSTKDPAQRARIVLAPNSDGFGSASSPKVVVWWLATEGGFGYREEGANTFNLLHLSVDIKVGQGNPGAVALRMQGAEGTGIHDVNIDLTESGHVGIWGIPGSGGSTHKVTVNGGDIGMDLRKFTDRDGPGTQPSPMMSGVTLINQKQYAVASQVRGALVMVGCRIVANRTGPVILLKQHFNGQPFDGMLGLVDCRIEYPPEANASVVIKQGEGNRSGRSFYANNTFVKNAVAMHKGDNGTAEANPDGWIRYKELAVDVGLGTRDGVGDIEDGIYLDGTLHGTNTILANTENDKEPPADLQNRHQWGDNFPSVESEGAVSIDDYSHLVESRPNNGKDWAPAIQAAVDANDIVFFPPGRYTIYGPVTLKPNTKLIGVSHRHSEIVGIEEYTWASYLNKDGGSATKPSTYKTFGDNTDPMNVGIPMIETADDPNAETAIAFLAIRPAFGRGAHDPAPMGHYSLKWQAGHKSIIRMVDFQPMAMTWMRYEYIWERYLELGEVDVPYSTGGLTFSSDCEESWAQYTLDSKILYEYRSFDNNPRLITRFHEPTANLTITKGGGSFGLTSIDISNGLYYDDDPRYTITFTGTMPGGETVTETYDFAVDGKENLRKQLETVTLNWSNLTKVEIASPSAFGVDNVRPEGGSAITFDDLTNGGDVSFICGRQWKGFEHYTTGMIFHPSVLVTNNGGGRWYNYWQHGDFEYDRDSRFVKVYKNLQPLKVYGVHMQHAQLDARWELNQARFVDIYDVKTENITTTMRIIDSDYIRVIGHGGMTNPPSGYNHYYIKNTPNFLVACMSEQVRWRGDGTVRGGSCDNPLALTPITMYDAVAEDFNGTRYTPDRLHRPVLYRRGQPSIWDGTGVRMGKGSVRKLAPVVRTATIGGLTQIRLAAPDATRTLTVRLLDVAGRTLATKQVEPRAECTMRNALSTGLYFLSVRAQGAGRSLHRVEVVK